MLNLIVLYPQPTNVEKFEADYITHTLLLHEKTGIPADARPYKVTKMMPTPTGLPQFYQMFSMPFNSFEELQAAMHSPGMQEVAADAQRISTGGPIVVMIGNES